MTKNWIDFWDTERVYDDSLVQRKSMEVFYEKTKELLNYNSEDIILDIGCGTGCLEELLANNAKEVYGVDTSQRYIDYCRNKFKGSDNVYFCKLKNDYTNLSVYCGKRFSKIIVLSVIQYYKNINEVAKLIEQIKSLALPGARLLIADIIVDDDSILSMTFNYLKTAFSKRYLFEAIKFMLRMKLSEYEKVRSTQGLLTISVDNLEVLIRDLRLDATIVGAHLTPNINRKHLLVNF